MRLFAEDKPKLIYTIPASWDELNPVSPCSHDDIFLSILREHGFGNLQPPIPLVARYSKGRRWSAAEFEACFAAWKRGVPLTLIAAALNRNPQDMIYKLLARCKAEGLTFSERGRSVGSQHWTPAVAACAAELFEAGLTAWRIAVLFRTDFEYVEKALFLARSDYGHKKRNPFSICSEHKSQVNLAIVRSRTINVNDALDAFAGEGKFTAALHSAAPNARITALEVDKDTLARAQSKPWPKNIKWLCQDNVEFMEEASQKGLTFDLIDLDPFVTCHRQLELVWPLLNPRSLLFVTFGGEYRRSFIKSNRKAIARRYGFDGGEYDNKSYLRLVPSFFLGWAAIQAARHGFAFEVIKSVRYPNICRFWLSTSMLDATALQNWLHSHTVAEHGGWRWISLSMPSFRRVRNEAEQAQQGRLF